MAGFLGGKFPVGQKEWYPWCDTGQFESHWAPPRRQVRHKNCFEIMTVFPECDSGCFEQRTRNLNLSFDHDYYGPEVGDALEQVPSDRM